MVQVSRVQQAPPRLAMFDASVAESSTVRPRCDRLRRTSERSVAAHLIGAKARAFTSAMLVDELRPLGVSRSTVYRTLQVLHRLHVLARVTVNGRRGYVVCEAADHHYHLTCSGCLAVVHLDLGTIESQIDRLAVEQRHFRILVHLVEVGGRCANCMAAG